MKAHLGCGIFVTLSLVCCVLDGTCGKDFKEAVTSAQSFLGAVPAKFREYTVILGPDKDEPEWPAGVVPVGIGHLFFYEGSDCDWYDPVYNIATGVGFTFDLHHVIDLTPESPLVVSTTPSEHFRTWRYSHWMWVGDELWAYAEVARPNESNEIRLFRLAWSQSKP